MLTESDIKKGQVTYIAPLQPSALASFRTWGIQRELIVQDLPRRKNTICFAFAKLRHR